MKCKSWSNKINNFVVRRLKSIKINGQQQIQQQQQQQQQTQQQQHQYLSTCSTMPAMPKEKATAVSLNESNFSELKLKELNSSATVVAAMATTAASRLHHLPPQSQSQPQQQQQYRQQQQQPRSVCGCGAASAEVVGSINHGSSKYVSNGHSSPLAAATAATQNGTSSPQRNSSTCCPSSGQRQQSQSQQNGNGCCEELRTAYTVAGGGGGGGGVGGGGGGGPTTSTTSRVTLSAASASSSSAYSSSSSSSSSLTSCNAAVTPPKKSPKDFIFGKYIGEGSFSSVYLAVDVNTKRDYAIKVCEKRHILREHKQEYVRREREVMHMMTNVPGFVNLSCTFQDSRSLFFVMTYAKNGDLLPYITKVGSFDMACTRHYVAELVLACEQMHRRNVVHRDLKPENILLDEDMHTLIADFGSAKILTLEDRAATAAQVAAAKATTDTEAKTRTMAPKRPSYLLNRSSDDDDDEGVDDTNDTGSDEDGGNGRRPRYHRKRRGSFVGTAQYVSPEVLQNGLITPSADLWALGCIVYQMISGLPPFRGSNDYVIFREILACNLDFPAGFDKDAEDLVRNLLKVKADERLGANDFGGRYESIRSHPFFDGIDFDSVRQQTPPPINPYLPGVSKDDDFRAQYQEIENMEPGLDDKQRTRLLGMELGTSLESAYNGTEKEEKTVTKNIFDLSDAEKQKRLEQQKSDKWHVFADNEVILRKGFVNKRKGLFARKRMLLLTTGPRLIYIDPVQMIKKGEIPWSAELRVEPKNFKIFFVHTPNRTYYLEDPDGYSLEWVAAIENMHKLTYSDMQKGDATPTVIATAAATATATGNDTQTMPPTSSLTPVASSGALSSTRTVSN